MNLNVQDLSQYIVLLIFILVILKVIGPGISASIIEMITGKKQTEEFELDDLIKQKTHQFKRYELSSTESNQSKPLILKIKESELSDKEKLIKLLSSLQWGVPDADFSKTSKEILVDIENTKGFSNFLTPFLEESFNLESKNLISTWEELYDKSVLWLNIVNSANTEREIKKVNSKYSKKSLSIFLDSNYTKQNQKSDEELNSITESLTRSEKVKELNIFDLNTQEIFNKWLKNVFIFKSLEPFEPISHENTSEWAKEVLSNSLEMESDISLEEIEKLNLSEDDQKIITKNLILIKKAHELLKS
jgi:hypothetical protein